jgi:hypothetical protein
MPCKHVDAAGKLETDICFFPTSTLSFLFPLDLESPLVVQKYLDRHSGASANYNCT